MPNAENVVSDHRRTALEILTRWILRGAAPALAVLRARRLVLANERWRELAASRPAARRWREVSRDGRPVGGATEHRSLRDVALAMAREVEDPSQPRRQTAARACRCFRRAGSERVLELTAELVGGGAVNGSLGHVVISTRELATGGRAKQASTRTAVEVVGSAEELLHDLRNHLMAVGLRARALGLDARCRAAHGRENLIIRRLLREISTGLDRLQYGDVPRFGSLRS